MKLHIEKYLKRFVLILTCEYLFHM